MTEEEKAIARFQQQRLKQARKRALPSLWQPAAFCQFTLWCWLSEEPISWL